MAARLDNVGQVCNAPKRFIVADELYEAFLDRFTDVDARGGRWHRADVVGPRRRGAPGAGEPAVVQGAVLRTAGERTGAFFPPGVLTGVTPDQDVVLPGALRAGRHGLPGLLGGRGRRAGQRHAVRPGLLPVHHRPGAGGAVANQIDAGMVFVNGVMLDAAELRSEA